MNRRVKRSCENCGGRGVHGECIGAHMLECRYSVNLTRLHMRPRQPVKSYWKPGRPQTKVESAAHNTGMDAIALLEEYGTLLGRSGAGAALYYREGLQAWLERVRDYLAQRHHA